MVGLIESKVRMMIKKSHGILILQGSTLYWKLGQTQLLEVENKSSTRHVCLLPLLMKKHNITIAKNFDWNCHVPGLMVGLNVQLHKKVVPVPHDLVW